MLGDEAAKLLKLGPGDDRARRQARVPDRRHLPLGRPLRRPRRRRSRSRSCRRSRSGRTRSRRSASPSSPARRRRRSPSGSSSKFPGIVAVVEPGQAVRIDTSSRLIITAGWIFSLLALIIGGIGVTNTMAMSVFERDARDRDHARGRLERHGGSPALIVSEALGIGVIALGIGLLARLGGGRAAHARTARCRASRRPTSPPASSPGGSRSRSASRCSARSTRRGGRSA